MRQERERICYRRPDRPAIRGGDRPRLPRLAISSWRLLVSGLRTTWSIAGIRRRRTLVMGFATGRSPTSSLSWIPVRFICFFFKLREYPLGFGRSAWILNSCPQNVRFVVVGSKNRTGRYRRRRRPRSVAPQRNQCGYGALSLSTSGPASRQSAQSCSA